MFNTLAGLIPERIVSSAEFLIITLLVWLEFRLTVTAGRVTDRHAASHIYGSIPTQRFAITVFWN